MLEFKKSVLQVKIEGVEYSIKFPTIKAVKSLQEQSKEGKELESTLSFLSALGLPVEVAEELEPAHLQAIVEALSGAKKN